jgi:hypothetical protein
MRVRAGVVRCEHAAACWVAGATVERAVFDLIEAKGQELDKNEMNTQLGAYKMEPSPEGESHRTMIKLKVDDWVRVRSQTTSFVDLLGMFLKVVAVETRPPQLGSYVVDVEIPDVERRRGLSAHEFELVKS